MAQCLSHWQLTRMTRVRSPPSASVFLMETKNGSARVWIFQSKLNISVRFKLYGNPAIYRVVPSTGAFWGIKHAKIALQLCFRGKKSRASAFKSFRANFIYICFQHFFAVFTRQISTKQKSIFCSSHPFFFLTFHVTPRNVSPRFT